MTRPLLLILALAACGETTAERFCGACFEDEVKDACVELTERDIATGAFCEEYFDYMADCRSCEPEGNENQICAEAAALTCN